MDKWIYYLIRAVTYPFSIIPYAWIRAFGKVFGLLIYYSMRNFRKRTFSNLALATDLALNPQEIFKIAKESFQNLATTCLEYPKLEREKNSISCENPKKAIEIAASGHAIIFFCGHQSNWEVNFLDATSRMKGVAIGKPFKNEPLYRWVTSIREKYGGRMISPKNALKEGLRALRHGTFLGVVGDQGMPGSGYSFPFLGRRAWTSTAPALLAYKTNSPIIFSKTTRIKSGFSVHHSEPIWPNLNEPVENEVVRMMDQLMILLQESIKKSPGEWFWQHNRWKQQTMRNIYKRYRQDCICLILPENLEPLLPHLHKLKEIYDGAFFTLLVPEKHRDKKLIAADEVIYYKQVEETLLKDYRFKLIFNFSGHVAPHDHYMNLSAFYVLDEKKLEELAKEHIKPEHNLSQIIERALCRPGSIWQKESHAI